MAIVGCSNDDVTLNKKFAEEQGFMYPLLCDTTLAVAIAFGAAADSSAGKAARIAALIDETGMLIKYWNPAGKGEFPGQVLSELA